MMNVQELIDILSKCDPDKKVGTFANNHFCDGRANLSVAERNGEIIIGNFDGYGLPTKAPYRDQFRDAITMFHKDSSI
jgi:hypothetical protein